MGTSCSKVWTGVFINFLFKNPKSVGRVSAGKGSKQKRPRSLYIDDAAEEDEDEDEDKEEEEQRHKKRKRGAAAFIDDAADVADEDEEEEDEEYADGELESF